MRAPMTLLACIITVVMAGETCKAALFGKLLKTTDTHYIADFSEGAAELTDISGNYKKVKVLKEECTLLETEK